MQGKKFQCVGSTLTPKFWHRYDKYNDDSNSKASPYLIVKLIFVIVNLNLNIFVLVNVPSVVLHNLNVGPFQFLCHAQAKRFCQLCTVLGNILHSTHCQQICTIMNNIAFICTTLHIIFTPQECCTLYICFGVQPMLCVAQYCVNPVFYSLAWNRMISPKIGVWSPKTGFVIMYIYCVLCFILSLIYQT